MVGLDRVLVVGLHRVEVDRVAVQERRVLVLEDLVVVATVRLLHSSRQLGLSVRQKASRLL
jgi:hypothetical protein